jgi:hypothetical protein
VLAEPVSLVRRVDDEGVLVESALGRVVEDPGDVVVDRFHEPVVHLDVFLVERAGQLLSAQRLALLLRQVPDKPVRQHDAIRCHDILYGLRRAALVVVQQGGRFRNHDVLQEVLVARRGGVRLMGRLGVKEKVEGFVGIPVLQPGKSLVGYGVVVIALASSPALEPFSRPRLPRNRGLAGLPNHRVTHHPLHLHDAVMVEAGRLGQQMPLPEPGRSGTRPPARAWERSAVSHQTSGSDA